MNPMTVRRLRQIHHYLGMFFAPAILFFAFSGAMQTFSLHENHDGGPYKPPAWIVTMASLHKDQALPAPKPPQAHRPHPSSQPHEADEHKPPEAARPSPLPLKIFVLCVATGLITSTSLGLCIGLRNPATRRASLAALALGMLLPTVLIWV
jgi:hypothetical protein